MMRDSAEKEIGGYIRLFGLVDWWMSEFTEAEREHIESKFQPMGHERGSRPLTQGYIRPISEWSSILRPHAPSAIGTLSGLAGWFKDPDDAYLALRILEKAGTCDGQALDWHFHYNRFVLIMWDVRRRLADAESRCLWACDQQIAMSLQARAAFFEKYPNQPLPGHAGFRRRAFFYEIEGEHDAALQLMIRANAEGWKGFEEGEQYLYQIRRNANAEDARRRAKAAGVRTKACPICKQRYVPGDRYCAECGTAL